MCAAQGEVVAPCCCHSSERSWVTLARGAGGVQEGGCPGTGLTGLWDPSGGCKVMWEVGCSKRQRCRMQHAGGHPRTWMLGPARGGSPPTAALGVLSQNSFSRAKMVWQIEPKFGLA